MTKGTPDEIIGMCLHLIFQSIGKVWRTQKANHLVVVFDGRSWRKSVYAPYKANRVDARKSGTVAEQELARLFFEAFDIFKAFIKEHTNCTALDHPQLEADDLIAHFIRSHPNDHHTIVSSDKDFEQLLAPNVNMYNGIDDTTITPEGIFNSKGKLVLDKKTGQPKIVPEANWAIFEKAIRGCPTDNVFSAYPGARLKGTRNKIGILDAYNDQEKKGFNWNAFMNHRWVDHTGTDHKVADDYHRNLGLVDLSAQPENIQEIIRRVLENITALNRNQIGLYFLKFCGKYQLIKVSDQAKSFCEMLGASYPSNYLPQDTK
jgi:5'-3' exonuclease, N-terminal resolvase-like domain